MSKGDIKLFGDDCLVLFYEGFMSGYSYTNIGYIEDTDGLEEALGSGNVTAKFEAR
ncbi:cyclophilin-like fold protein [Ruminococcus sp.]|uniref:cyclophilin-like fold protein n=1 Tax=Ruminococcus sp. TaxID=41978 RepID=UPI0025F0E5DA|nr:cyclophilin-like fold protein [Ruminococcus sp.]